MKPMKQAQITQVLFYILGLVVVSLLLLYGYQAVSKFTSKADEIGILQLTRDIENAIKQTNTDFGSVIKKEISIPSRYERVCFVDLDQPPNPPLCNTVMGSDHHAAVCDSWTGGGQSNLFLVQSPSEVESFFVGTFEIPSPHFTCIKVDRSKISLRLEGVGGRTSLKEWS